MFAQWSVRMGACRRDFRRRLEQVEVVQLVAILHNVPLNLGSRRPCDEILHRPGHDEGLYRGQSVPVQPVLLGAYRIGDCLSPYTNVALLYELDGGSEVLCHT